MTPRANPFALSVCGNFVVERHPGEIYPNVMTVDEAMARQKRSEADAAGYERTADHADRFGVTRFAEVDRAFAQLHLTIAAEIAEALNGAQAGRIAA